MHNTDLHILTTKLETLIQHTVLYSRTDQSKTKISNDIFTDLDTVDLHMLDTH